MSIVLDPTIGITNVNGTAAAPALTGADTNTGIFYGTDIVGISTGGSERLRVDASGNVGIGTSSPADSGGFGKCIDGNSSTGFGYYARGNSSTNYFALGWSSNNGYLNLRNSGNIILGTNDTERMRIDSSGNVLINATAQIAGEKLQVSAGGSTINTAYFNFTTTDDRGNIICKHARATGATTGQQIAFLNSAGTNVGAVNSTTSATSYATSSDYRLKENVQPMVGALDKVAQLKPVTYTWKIDGTNGQGFIAHELQAIVPDAVVGKKDAVDAEGNPKYQGVDTSFLVATLTAAIQEQQTIINDLKARIETLESK